MGLESGFLYINGKKWYYIKIYENSELATG